MASMPRTQDERNLELFQRRVTDGEIALRHRDELLYKMWSKDDYTHQDLAERLSRVAQRASQEGYSRNAVQKITTRLGNASEDDAPPIRNYARRQRKLSDEDVESIRSSDKTARTLAEEYGVSISLIRNVIQKREAYG
jgi:hypothetical protein